MASEIPKSVILKCLGFKKGEHLLIVCDDKSRPLALDFYHAAQRLDGECVLMQMSTRRMHGEEPPPEIAAALRQANIALLLTSMSLSHTLARKEASQSGTRIASSPGITAAIVKRSLAIDYFALSRKAKRLAELLTRGKQVRIYTDKGTDLSMSIGGRKGYADDGLYIRPGAFGNLPAGEACIAPCEGSTNGTLVVDGSAALIGRVHRPVRIKIKNGLIQNIPWPRIRSLIKPLGKCALNIAELGIGLNHKARVTGNVLEDEKAKSTAHLAIGANISFGGRITCPCHLDLVFFNPLIFIDGKKIKI